MLYTVNENKYKHIQYIMYTETKLVHILQYCNVIMIFSVLVLCAQVNMMFVMLETSSLSCWKPRRCVNAYKYLSVQ
jgi:hypothetical protein